MQPATQIRSSGALFVILSVDMKMERNWQGGRIRTSGLLILGQIVFPNSTIIEQIFSCKISI